MISLLAVMDAGGAVETAEGAVDVMAGLGGRTAAVRAVNHAFPSCDHKHPSRNAPSRPEKALRSDARGRAGLSLAPSRVGPADRHGGEGKNRKFAVKRPVPGLKRPYVIAISAMRANNERESP
jgi:hypothetical protein